MCGGNIQICTYYYRYISNSATGMDGMKKPFHTKEGKTFRSISHKKELFFSQSDWPEKKIQMDSVCIRWWWDWIQEWTDRMAKQNFGFFKERIVVLQKGPDLISWKAAQLALSLPLFGLLLASKTAWLILWTKKKWLM